MILVSVLQQLIQAKMECKQLENELKVVKQTNIEEKKTEKSDEGAEEKVRFNMETRITGYKIWHEVVLNLDEIFS